MPECLEQELTVVEASSPSGLEKALNGLLADNAKCSRYLSVLIQGPKVLTRQFELTNTPVCEIKENLLAEVSQLLSLTTDEIELDFQILNSTEKIVSGVYISIPKDVLAQYVAVLDRMRFYPVKITAYPLATSEAFLELHSSGGGIVPFFDLTREGVVSLAVFKGDICMLLREIPFENRKELEKEVTQTLRWAYSKRNGTGLDSVYFAGKPAVFGDIVLQVKDQFKTEVKFIEPDSIREALCLAGDFFIPNLAKPYYCSRNRRDLIRKIVNVGLCCVVLLSGLMAFKIAGRSTGIKKMKAMFSQGEYLYAVKLQEQMKEKGYAK